MQRNGHFQPPRGRPRARMGLSTPSWRYLKLARSLRGAYAERTRAYASLRGAYASLRGAYAPVNREFPVNEALAPLTPLGHPLTRNSVQFPC